MSKQAEAELILKLYELRREETMRSARNWYFREFQPRSMADIRAAMFSEHSGHLRMVLSYWDMAASMVNHGAISLDFFNDANAEHIGTFAKVEPWLAEMRAELGPAMCLQLERMIDATPNGREAVEGMRERMKAVLAELANQRTTAEGARPIGSA